jgi:hypothetical protein
MVVGHAGGTRMLTGYRCREMRRNNPADYLRTVRRRATFRPTHAFPENPMHDAPNNHAAGRHVPFKQEGWGIALFVVLLAVASATAATLIHKNTYRHPTDVRFQATGSGAAHE